MEDLARNFLSKYNRFSNEEIELIIQNTKVEHFKKGESIVREGVVARKCYLVVSGCLRQYHIVGEEEKTVGFYTEGDPIVIYSSYLNSKPSEYTVQCLENCTLISGTKEDELKMSSTHPSLEYLTHNIMKDDYEKAENYISLLNNCNAEQRYLMFMETRPRLLNRVPLLYIASYLGMTPESLSRIRKRIGRNSEE